MLRADLYAPAGSNSCLPSGFSHLGPAPGSSRRHCSGNSGQGNRHHARCFHSRIRTVQARRRTQCPDVGVSRAAAYPVFQQQKPANSDPSAFATGQGAYLGVPGCRCSASAACFSWLFKLWPSWAWMMASCSPCSLVSVSQSGISGIHCG